MKSLSDIRDELAEDCKAAKSFTQDNPSFHVSTVYAAYREGFDACAKALREMSPEFDEREAAYYGAENTGKIIAEDGFAKGKSATTIFIQGARWRYEKDKAMIAALKAEIERLKK